MNYTAYGFLISVVLVTFSLKGQTYKDGIPREKRLEYVKNLMENRLIHVALDEHEKNANKNNPLYAYVKTGMIVYFTLGEDAETLCFYSLDGQWTNRSVDTYITDNSVGSWDGKRAWVRNGFKRIIFLHASTPKDNPKNIIKFGNGRNKITLTEFAAFNIDELEEGLITSGGKK